MRRCKDDFPEALQWSNASSTGAPFRMNPLWIVADRSRPYSQSRQGISG